MRLLLPSIAKDLTRWWQDKGAILLWLGVPALVGTLVTSLMSDGSTPVGLLLIADQDQSFLSSLVAGAYGQGELGELLSVEKTTLAEGRARVDNGDASGLLIIPEGFGDAVLEQRPAALRLRTNPAQTILPGIISDVTGIILDAAFYADLVFREEIDRIRSHSDGPPEAAVTAAIAVAIQTRIEDAAPLLFPPAIDLSVSDVGQSEESRAPLSLLFLPGVILMAMLFGANSLAEDYWAERERGTLRRLLLAPDQVPGFVLGKALAATALITLVTSVIVVAGFAYHGISWLKLPLTLLWVAAGTLMLFTWMSLLQMAMPNRSAASLAGSLVIFPLLMLGGSFFPLAALPDWIATLGRFTPNGFVAERLTLEFTGSGVGSFDPLGWSVLLGSAAIALAAAGWWLRSGFARA